MKLFIDTSNSEKIVVGLDDERFTADAREEKAQMLLAFIDEVLKKKNRKIKDITEIEVNTGPGSFTGLRVGLSVANTIGWVLGIPVTARILKKTVRFYPNIKNKKPQEFLCFGIRAWGFADDRV